MKSESREIEFKALDNPEVAGEVTNFVTAQLVQFIQRCAKLYQLPKLSADDLNMNPHYLVQSDILSNTPKISIYVNGTVVGYAEWKLSRKRSFMLITSIYVHEEYHRTGIGTALLTKVVESMKRNNISRCHVDVSQRDGVALDFYRNFGFEILGKYFFVSKFKSDDYIIGRYRIPTFRLYKDLGPNEQLTSTYKDRHNNLSRLVGRQKQ